MLLVWDSNAWEDYLWWQARDRKVVTRINLLFQDVVRNGNQGIGKPEPLKQRLVYKVTEDEVRTAVCRCHHGR